MSEKPSGGIKSAYELAMERLGGDAPQGPGLDAETKEALARVDREAQAKLAELEILTDPRLAAAAAAGDAEALDKLREEKARDVRRVQEKAEAEKERIRQRG